MSTHVNRLPISTSRSVTSRLVHRPELSGPFCWLNTSWVSITIFQSQQFETWSLWNMERTISCNASCHTYGHRSIRAQVRLLHGTIRIVCTMTAIAMKTRKTNVKCTVKLIKHRWINFTELIVIVVIMLVAVRRHGHCFNCLWPSGFVSVIVESPICSGSLWKETALVKSRGITNWWPGVCKPSTIQSSPKIGTHFSVHLNFTKILTDFQNYFTIRKKCVIILTLKIPSLLKCVATLAEMKMSVS